MLVTSVATGKQAGTPTSIFCSKQFYFFFRRDVWNDTSGDITGLNFCQLTMIPCQEYP